MTRKIRALPILNFLMYIADDFVPVFTKVQTVTNAGFALSRANDLEVKGLSDHSGMAMATRFVQYFV